MDSLLDIDNNSKPNNDDQDQHLIIPNWAYGAIAGGTVIIGATTVYFINLFIRKKRKADDIKINKEIKQDDLIADLEKITPREDNPI